MGVGAILDGVHDSGELALDFVERSLVGKRLTLGGCSKIAHFFGEFIDEGGDQIGRHHSLPESTSDAVLARMATYQQSVRANALGSVCRAPFGTDVVPDE